VSGSICNENVLCDETYALIKRARQHLNVIEAAGKAGVQWIVYTSLLHADPSTLNLAGGHTKCGAVISTCNHIKAGHLTGLLEKIRPAINKEVTTKVDQNGANNSFVNNVSIIHVQLMMNQIRIQSRILNQLEKEGKILIVGSLYDIDSGQVTFFDI